MGGVSRVNPSPYAAQVKSFTELGPKKANPKPEVQYLQQQLKAWVQTPPAQTWAKKNKVTLPKPETIDTGGDYGSTTESLVKTYQRANGLHVDGLVGDQTWSALQGAKGNQVLAAGTTDLGSSYTYKPKDEFHAKPKGKPGTAAPISWSTTQTQIKHDLASGNTQGAIKAGTAYFESQLAHSNSKNLFSAASTAAHNLSQSGLTSGQQTTIDDQVLNDLSQQLQKAGVSSSKVSTALTRVAGAANSVDNIRTVAGDGSLNFGGLVYDGPGRNQSQVQVLNQAKQIAAQLYAAKGDPTKVTGAASSAASGLVKLPADQSINSNSILQTVMNILAAQGAPQSVQSAAIQGFNGILGQNNKHGVELSTNIPDGRVVPGDQIPGAPGGAYASDAANGLAGMTVNPSDPTLNS
jgi:hypothetical protein